MATPKEHIEEIRKTKFWIGRGELNPLREDFLQAVKHLSAELYAKDVHFIMELIQNAEDNEYPEGVKPSLEFIITSQDITNTGATATLLLFNNEKGFSPKNIASICSVGLSTKKGNRKRGYIGEKGIGFKSVFQVTTQPYIFSNGYQIRFNEQPCPHCDIGYIVPEWVEQNPTLADIKQIYGTQTALPTTTIILPLRPDKIKAVEQQLSCVQPEVLLFLSKIKQFSVKQVNADPKLNTVKAISISSEINFVTRKNIDADSYTLHLSAGEANESSEEKECSYYMWRQKFPVREENRVERRLEVEELVITLAFPYGQRLNRGKTSPGVYAFLPTEMITNFPFIIQADFVLASSRETILLDNRWNQGILDCVPSAFLNAFKSLITRSEDVPVSSLVPLFRFLPIYSSSYKELDDVRESIRKKFVSESIIPCESYSDQKIFRKPSEVGRLMPCFWDILKKAGKQGVSLHSLSSHGKYILNSAFDGKEYDNILKFLGVEHVDNEWYAKCIKSSDLVLGVKEDDYLELLLFFAEKWSSSFCNTGMKDVPLLKYVGPDGNIVLCAISKVTKWNGESMICMSQSDQSEHISWLIDWNKVFIRVTDLYFMPVDTRESISSFRKRETLLEWLQNQVKVRLLTVNDLAYHLCNSIKGERQLAIVYVHFLHHSFSKKYLQKGNVDYLCCKMPLVDNYGNVGTHRSGVLVPAKGSKWVGLIGANPWKGAGYVELGEDYLRSGRYAGSFTPEGGLLKFLITHVAASDIPDISPPNAELSAAYAPLTKLNAFLLLDWIHNLRSRRGLPAKFLASIKDGSWLRISLNGSLGHRPPSQCFLLTSSDEILLQDKTVMVDIPLIDQSYYGNEIGYYRDELKAVGVMFEYGEACVYMGKHIMSLAASSALTRSNVFEILNFIKFMRCKFLPADQFIQSIKDGRWLKTASGYKSPVGSVLFDQEWEAARQISDLPFIDQDYYGSEILSFKVELQLLGVIVGFDKNYQLVSKHLKSHALSNSPKADSILLILECIRDCERNSRSSNNLIQALQVNKCLKTQTGGYKFPGECFLFDPEWGCLLKVFCKEFALIDENFYGNSISFYKRELKQAGVVLEFEAATKKFLSVFKKHAASPSFGKENVVAFLKSYRQINKTNNKFPPDFLFSIRHEKWLQTRLGVRKPPTECILFGQEWEAISSITLLPFIDESENYYGQGIREYTRELKSLGVTTKYKDGASFVTNAIFFPQYPSTITPQSVLSLLQCIKILLERGHSLNEAFRKKLSHESWLKTNAGYRSPQQSLMFGPKWAVFLERADGPFIDEAFYGPDITAYQKELREIGVTIDVTKGCSLLASYLDSHSEFSTIVRVYKYLNIQSWSLSGDAPRKVWIPTGSDSGKWVCPEKCVLHDKDGLFSSYLHVLEKHYEKELLCLFSRVMQVKSNPSVEDYCQLWKYWENSRQKLSHSECCAFWGYISKHWSKNTEKILADRLKKLPVESVSSEGIILLDKNDVLIADDLQLKYLFAMDSPRPIFVWYPQPSIPSVPRTKLFNIYRTMGVRTISDSVQKEDISKLEDGELKQVSLGQSFVRKSLLKLVLGFLADPSIGMEAGERQEAVKGLLNLKVFETEGSIAVRYRLALSSGEPIEAEAERMMRWEREESKFFMQKMEKSGGHGKKIEYATIFSEVLSEGVLQEKEEYISGLSELIKLAFLLELDEEAVGFLMRSKNLQVFLEDEEFLCKALSLD